MSQPKAYTVLVVHRGGSMEVRWIWAEDCQGAGFKATDAGGEVAAIFAGFHQDLQELTAASQADGD